MKTINVKKNAFFLIVFCCIFSACRSRPTDKAIQQNVDQQLSGNENYKGVTATVHKGVVTLNGTCIGADCAADIEKSVKEKVYVDSVINNVQQQKMTTTTSDLNTSLQKIVSKYPGVRAEVADSVITLYGSLTESNLSVLLNEVSGLDAKKVVDKIATVMR